MKLLIMKLLIMLTLPLALLAATSFGADIESEAKQGPSSKQEFLQTLPGIYEISERSLKVIGQHGGWEPGDSIREFSGYDMEKPIAKIKVSIDPDEKIDIERISGTVRFDKTRYTRSIKLDSEKSSRVFMEGEPETVFVEFELGNYSSNEIHKVYLFETLEGRDRVMLAMQKLVRWESPIFNSSWFASNTKFFELKKIETQQGKD